MSQRTRKPVRAGVWAALAASVVSVGLLAPSASAAPIPGPLPLPGLVGSICETKDLGQGDGPGIYCDANDIAPLLSGTLDPALNLTCLDKEKNFIICRVDEAPDSDYLPGGEPA